MDPNPEPIITPPVEPATIDPNLVIADSPNPTPASVLINKLNANPSINPDINLLTGEIVDPSTQRHFLAAFFFSFIFGVFGADRFYLGKIWTGILKFLTFGGLGVWALIDLNTIMSGNMRDKQGNKLLEAEKYKKFASRTILIFSLVIGAMVILISAIVVYVTVQLTQSGGLDSVTQLTSGGKLNIWQLLSL